MRRKSDPAHAETDQILAGLEGKISKEYEKAEKEVAEKLQKHLSDFSVKEKRKLEEVKAGILTQAEFDQWRVGQIMIGERWKEMRATLAQDLHNANRLARSMVNGHMPEVYAINHNYGTFLVEKGSLLDTSYTLYDRQTVERLMRDNPDLLKPPGKQMKQTFGEFDAYKRGEAVKITPKKKRAFDKLIRENKDIRWQAGKIQSVTLQSILQGESIPNMCRRIAREMGEINRAATTRYARTATTAAENAGRIDSFKRADEMGIDMKQMWIATLDDRTRHEHRVLDGQIRPVGEPFEVEGYEIAYPGDPDAEAFLVYNCRCTLGAVVAGTRLAEEGLEAMERVPGYQEASYEEWKEMHKEPGTKARAY